jgi:hypothetical protein
MNKIIFSCFVILFGCLGHAAWAEAPVAEIFGASESRAGDLCVITTDGSEGKDFKWVVVPQEKYAGAYYIADSGRTMIFASTQAGEVTFVLAVAAEDAVAMASHTLKNGEIEPDPEPEPEPGPDPIPPTPSGLAEWVAAEINRSVPPGIRQATLSEMSRRLRLVCEQIARGEIAQPRAARESVRRSIDGALDANQEVAWRDFRDALSRKLTTLADENQLDSMEQIEMAYRAIAKGMEAAE